MTNVLRCAGLFASLLTLWFLTRSDEPGQALQLSLAAAYIINTTVNAYRSKP